MGSDDSAQEISSPVKMLLVVKRSERLLVGN